MARKNNSRAPDGAGSIRQRPDGIWEARITISTETGVNGQVRRSIYGKTMKEVRQRMTAIQQSIDAGLYQTPSKITVSEWLSEWLETFCKPKVKPLTYSAYKASIETHITQTLGNIKLQALKGMQIQRLYNGMTASGISGKSVKNMGAILHKAFSVAIKQGLISVNPCDAAELPKVVHKEIQPFTDAEIPIFLKAIESHPFKNAYAVDLFTGMREGELLGLSWPQVDFKNKRIVINQQLQREKIKGGKYYIAHSTKSGKSRTIKPPDITFRYLMAERVRQAENQLAAGEFWNNPDNLVFTNEKGRHLAIFTFYKNFKTIAASIGRPDARPHDLRHTAATVAIASGADIKSVQDMLGHSTASFTLNVYAHTSEKMKEDTAARVQSYYDNLAFLKEA